MYFEATVASGHEDVRDIDLDLRNCGDDISPAEPPIAGFAVDVVRAVASVNDIYIDTNLYLYPNDLFTPSLEQYGRVNGPESKSKLRRGTTPMPVCWPPPNWSPTAEINSIEANGGLSSQLPSTGLRCQITRNAQPLMLAVPWVAGGSWISRWCSATPVIRADTLAYARL